MTDSDLPIPEPVEIRINRRLRTKYARWFVRQPRFHSPWFHSPWFQAIRRACRVWRRGCNRIDRGLVKLISWIGRQPIARLLLSRMSLIAVFTIVVGAFAALLLWLIAVVPSVMLLAEPERRPFVSESERVSVALTRLAIPLSFAILVLLSMMPGAARTTSLTINAVNTNNRGNQKNRRTLIKTISRRATRDFTPNGLRWTIAITTMLIICALVGVLIRLPHAIVAAVAGIGFCASTAWCVYRLALRLKRYRGQLIGLFSPLEYCGTAVGFIGLILMIPLYSSASVYLARGLPMLGPIGWQLDQLRTLGGGDLTSLIPISLYGSAMLMLGWYVAKDAGTWHNRRKMIESQRLMLAAPVDAVNETVPLTRDQLQRRIRLGLDQNVDERRYSTWQFWLTPGWIRRYFGYYLLLGASMLLFQGLLIPIASFVSTLEPAEVIGGDVASPGAVISTLVMIPVAFMLVAIETMALLSNVSAAPNMLAERPTSSLRHWYEVQRDGLLRVPTQLVLLSPFLGLLLMSETNRGLRYDFMFLAVATLFLGRTFVATHGVVHAVMPTLRGWVTGILLSAELILAYAMLMGTMVLFVTYGQAEISLTRAQLLLTAANVAAGACLLFFARLRQPPERRIVPVSRDA